MNRRQRHSPELWISRLVLTVLLLGMWSVASAQPTKGTDGCLSDPTCRAAYDKALGEYDSKKYDDALAGFQAAYARRQMPWLLINIGRTVQRLGRPQEAINYYERYKKAEPNITPEAEARVNKFIEQAKALLEQTPEQPDLATQPPKVVTPPAPVEPPPQPLVLGPPPPPPPEAKPIYKKWWFWTIIGGVVAVGGVTAIVIGTSAKKSPPADPFMPDDPIFTPTF